MIRHLVVSTDEPGVLVDEVRVLQQGQELLDVVDDGRLVVFLVMSTVKSLVYRERDIYIRNCKLSEPNLLPVSLRIISQSLQYIPGLG